MIYQHYMNLKFLGKFRPPTEEDMQTKTFKSATFDRAIQEVTPYIRSILEEMMKNFRKEDQVCVDVKVHDLKKGKFPCLPGWHVDGTKHSLKEKHLLFVSGEHNRTLFMESQLEMGDMNPINGAHCSVLDELIASKKMEGEAIPANMIVEYDNRFPHRSQECVHPEKRLLIRMSYSPDLRPVLNSDFECKLYD